MANNPHLPYDERLQAIADSGLGWAAGVPFHVNHHKGIVIYVARKTVDHGLLQDTSNEQYLLSAADLIGSAWALREPRRLALAARKAKREAAIRRARLKILTLIRWGAKFDFPEDKEDPQKSTRFGKEVDPLPPSVCEILQEKATQAAETVQTVAKKCRGSNNRPPPPFDFQNSLFTFLGSFFLLTLLAGINNIVVSNHGKDFLLLMPPFGGELLHASYEFNAYHI